MKAPSIYNEQRLISDSLGFRLEVLISFGNFSKLGEHRTYEGKDGKVADDAVHRININPTRLSEAELAGVVAHEVYHLFYSIRHLIVADEESQAEVFGDLVRSILATKDKAADNRVATGKEGAK